MSDPAPSIDVYPVGLLADLKHFRHRPTRYRLRQGLGYVLGSVRARQWRSVRNYLNGYLAEINYPPEGLVFRSCGHGWTRRRACARLGLYLARSNPGQGTP